MATDGKNRKWMRDVECPYVMYGRNVMNTQMVEMSTSRVREVPSLLRYAVRDITHWGWIILGG